MNVSSCWVYLLMNSIIIKLVKDVVLPAGLAMELMLRLLSSNNVTSDIRPAVDLIRDQLCGPSQYPHLSLLQEII